MPTLPRLGNHTIRNRAQQRFTTAHRGEEAIRHRLLELVAHRQQRVDQRGQRQLEDLFAQERNEATKRDARSGWSGDGTPPA